MASGLSLPVYTFGMRPAHQGPHNPGPCPPSSPYKTMDRATDISQTLVNPSLFFYALSFIFYLLMIRPWSIRFFVTRPAGENAQTCSRHPHD